MLHTSISAGPALAGAITLPRAKQVNYTLDITLARYRELSLHLLSYAEFGNPVACPDGGIAATGVWMSNVNGRSYCAAWDSDMAALGSMQCDGLTCTKMQAAHIHATSRKCGVLMVKRLKCDEAGCKVYKVPPRTLSLSHIPQ